MIHLTMSTGHSRFSPRDEVDAGMIGWAQDVLLEHLEASGDRLQEPIRLPRDLHTYGITAAAANGALVATAWAMRDDDPPARLPLASWWTATDAESAAECWRLAVENEARARALRTMVAGAAPVVPVGCPASVPWCAVVFEIGLLLDPSAGMWLGDLERVVAWAWIDRQRGAVR